MAGISSAGIGSGIDVQGLVSQLVAAEGAPKQARLDRRETQLQAQVSAMGAIKSALAQFQSSYLNLKLSSTFSKLSATSSNESLFTATANSQNIDKTSHSIVVDQLSQAHRLTSAPTTAILDSSATIGTGTITIDFGTYDSVGDTFTADASRQATINITDGSLTGIRDAINGANAGVSASIIYTGSDYQLVLNSDSGAANTMKIAVSGDSDGNDTDNAGLSMLNFDPVTTGNTSMNQAVAAQDAMVHIDGVAVTSATDTITDAIPGVTLNLKSADPLTTASLSISSNTSSLATQAQSFVESYNALASLMKDLTYYNAETKEKGLFIGDAMMRGIEGRMRSILNTTVGNPSDPRVKYNSFAMVGITTNQDGTLNFDSSKFNAAVGDNLEQVRNLFTGGLSGTQNSPTVNNLDFLYTPSNLQADNIGINISAAATHGTFTGAVSGAIPTLTATTDYLKLKVDGGSEITVDTLSGLLTGADLATQLQNAINTALINNSQKSSVTVNYDANTNQFSLLSNKWGSASTIDITNASANFATLGFAPSFAGSYVSGVVAAPAGTYTMDATDTFNISVDGGTSVTVNTVSGTGLTHTDIATQMQGAINGALATAGQSSTVKVSFDTNSNRYIITSNNSSTGSIAMTGGFGGDYATNLGFSTYTQNTYSGSFAAGANAYTTADTLTLSLDGGAGITVSLNGTYDETTISSALQSAINAELIAKNQSGSVTVSYSGGNLSIASANSSGSVFVSDVQGMFSTVGLSKYTSNRGFDVQGTIGGETATGSGRVLTGSGNLYNGMEVEYFGSTSTYSDRIANVHGILSGLDGLLDSYLDSNGIIDARNNSFNDQIDSITGDRERLATRLSDLEQRYLSKFGAMDALVAQMNATSDYLSNQLKNLPSTSRNR